MKQNRTERTGLSRASSVRWVALDAPPSGRREDGLHAAVALVLTLLLHLLFFWLVPESTFARTISEDGLERTYEIALVPEEPEEMRFVHTNPDVAQNEPDTTRNIAARDQQAAQEDPDPRSRDQMPTLDGEEPESTQIVEGTLDEQPLPLPPAPDPSEATPANSGDSNPDQSTRREAARPELRAIPQQPPTPPAPDFLQQDPESVDGPGSTTGPTGEAQDRPEEEIDRVIPITAPLPVESDPLDGAVQPPSDQLRPDATREGERREAAEERNPTPRPRPRLDPLAVPAPLMQSNEAASRRGNVAVDANFSEYGDYLQRLVEAVSRAWNASVNRVELIRERPSRVRVRFSLNAQGQVSRLRVVDKTPNAQLLATGLCMDAIQSRAPYDRWTPQMIETLGTEQEITFTFHYY